MDSYVLVATSFGCARCPSSVAYLKYALYVTEDDQHEKRLPFASENSIQNAFTSPSGHARVFRF